MISVIMPAYNAESYLQEAIDSILNQTIKDLELIIVDDGSTDRTVEIIQSNLDRDPRIRLIQNEHQGANKARNTAIMAAKYPWIGAMDADDIAEPNRLERLLQAAEEDPEVVVWGSYMNQINQQGKITYKIRVGPTSKAEFYALDRTKDLIALYNPAAMFRRDVAIQVGLYDERLKAAQDSELWDRMAEHGPVVVIPEFLLNYRVHDKQMSLVRLAEQRKLHGFPKARNKAKAEGKTLTLDQYLEDYKNKPLPERIRRFIRFRSDYYYRKAAAHYDKREYSQLVFSLTIAFLMRPFNVTRRIIGRLTKQDVGYN